jgi:hypothetical protein
LISSAKAFNLSNLRAPRRSFDPKAANDFAQAIPIPLLAPVMKTTFPLNDIISLFPP